MKRKRLRIVTERDQLQEGLFGQVLLWVFEILPYLKREGIRPAWQIRSPLYQTSNNAIVIPGLLDVAYDISADEYEDVNLEDIRRSHVACLGNDWRYLAALWSDYFQIPERIIQRAVRFPSLDRALGLHYRGTDKNRATDETNPVSRSDFLSLTRAFVREHPDIAALYVATDEYAVVQEIQEQHPDLPIINSGKVTHHKHAAEQGGLGKGDHALIDCLLLSRCRYVVKCQSALSGFCKILNPDVEIYRIAANKLARWAHGVPYFPDAYLPVLPITEPHSRRVLSRLMEGDWTQDKIARRKYSASFGYRPRKGYMKRNGAISKWSWDGIHERIDRKLDQIRRMLW